MAKRRNNGLERDDRGRFLRRVRRRKSKKRRRRKTKKGPKKGRARRRKRSGKGIRSTIMEFINCGKKGKK